MNHPLLFRVVVFGILIWGASGSIAQSIDYENFGEVSVEELEMEFYTLEPNADAVILKDVGIVSVELVNSNPNVYYEYFRRIKILSEEGLAWAKITLPFVLEDRVESVSGIMGATYNLNGEGEPVQFKLDKKKITEQKKDKVKRSYRLNFPFVRVGSVIEYSYTISSKNMTMLKDWQFQRELPVLYSEYHTFVPNALSYVRMFNGKVENLGHRSVDYENKRYNLNAGNPQSRAGSISNESANFGRYYGRLQGIHDSYTMLDVPAIKQESFSPELNQYVPSIRLQLDKNETVSGTQSVVFESWEEFDQQMTKRLKLKRIRKATRKRIHVLVNRLTENEYNDNQKAIQLYNYVRENYEWSGIYEAIPLKPQLIPNNQSGSGTELNLLLLRMLREAGVPADPVFIATRDFGNVQVDVPNLAQFNHMIIAIDVEGVDMLVDVLSEVREMGILPKNDLNQVGYVMKESGGEWTPLQSQNQINRTTYSRFYLNDKGILLGDISVQNRNYSASVEKERLEEFKNREEAYLKEFVLVGMDKPVILNNSVEFSEALESMLVVNCELSTRDFVEKTDEFMIIKPMMVKQVVENPFEAKDRRTPVDLAYPVRESHMIGLKIPAGYEVAQLPQPIRVLLPNNGGSFTYNVLENEDILHLTSTILINQTTYMPHEYPGIRSFFDYVVKKHGEDVILRKMQ